MGIGVLAGPHHRCASVESNVRAVCHSVVDRGHAGNEIAGEGSKDCLWVAATSGIAAATRLEFEHGECDGQLAEIG